MAPASSCNTSPIVGSARNDTFLMETNQNERTEWSDLPLAIKLLILYHYFTAALEHPQSWRMMEPALDSGRTMLKKEIPYNHYLQSVTAATRMIMNVANANSSLRPLVGEMCAHRIAVAGEKLAGCLGEADILQRRLLVDVYLVAGRVSSQLRNMYVYLGLYGTSFI
jgi:hypothetical protein